MYLLFALVLAACGDPAQELEHQLKQQELALQHRESEAHLAAERQKRRAAEASFAAEQRLAEAYLSAKKLSKNEATGQLIGACKDGNYPMVKALVDRGADVNTTNQQGYTPLMFAAGSGGDVQIVKLLLEKGARVNAQEWYSGPMGGTTALMSAAWDEYPEIVKALLDSGAKADIQNHSGWTARDYAVRIGNDEIVRILDAHN